MTGQYKGHKASFRGWILAESWGHNDSRDLCD